MTDMATDNLAMLPDDGDGMFFRRLHRVWHTILLLGASRLARKVLWTLVRGTQAWVKGSSCAAAHGAHLAIFASSTAVGALERWSDTATSPTPTQLSMRQMSPWMLPVTVAGGTRYDPHQWWAVIPSSFSARHFATRDSCHVTHARCHVFYHEQASITSAKVWSKWKRPITRLTKYSHHHGKQMQWV